MREHLERKQRDDGTAFYTMTDGAPDWFHDAVMAAHDDEMPNDWRYDTIDSICELVDSGEDDGTAIADCLVDTYTNDLVAWLAGNIGRLSYTDRMHDEWGNEYGELESEIRMGQLFCIAEMADVLIAAHAENEAMADN